MPNFTEAEIVTAAAKVILATGASSENALLVARLLAEANATGHESAEGPKIKRTPPKAISGI